MGKSGSGVKSMTELAAEWSSMAEEEKARLAQIMPPGGSGTPRKRKRPGAAEPAGMPAELTPLGVGDEHYPLAHDRIGPLVDGAGLKQCANDTRVERSPRSMMYCIV